MFRKNRGKFKTLNVSLLKNILFGKKNVTLTRTTNKFNQSKEKS